MHKILIFGYGRVGKTIASNLDVPKQEIVVLDHLKEVYDEAVSDGCNAILSSMDVDTDLISAGVGSSAKYLYCVTNDDDFNLYVTLSARALDKNIHIMARAQDENTKSKLKLAGANDTIDFNAIGAHKISSMLATPLAYKVMEGIVYKNNDFYDEYKLTIEEIYIDEDSYLIGEALMDLDLRKEFGVILLGVYCKNRGFLFNISGTNHIIKSGDVLVVVGNPEHISIIKSTLSD